MSFDKFFYLLDHRLIALAMVVLLVAAGEIGYRRGMFRRESKESVRSLMSGTAAAMLGLLGLLLGFTLAMAVSRWDERREVIVNETNSIDRLWLRAGLLEAPLRNELRDALREYADERIALGGSRGDRAALGAARSESEALHVSIWSVVERANQLGQSNAVMKSLIDAASDVIDLHELRLASIENYLPAPLFLLLFTVASVSVAFFAWAFGAANQGGRAAIVALALLIGAVLLVIMDINRPQRGRIKIGIESLQRVEDSMGAALTRGGLPAVAIPIDVSAISSRGYFDDNSEYIKKTGKEFEL